MHEPISPKNLSLSYSATEDRLIVVATAEEDPGLALLFTRRLTGRLINGLAAILEKSSVKVARAPAEFRKDVVLLEHQGALERLSPKAGEGGSGPPAPVRRRGQLPSALITSVDIKSNPRHFEVVMKSGERAMVRLTARRNDLHRFLDVLKAKAQEADWGIKVTATWLDSVQSGITVN